MPTPSCPWCMPCRPATWAWTAWEPMARLTGVPYGMLDYEEYQGVVKRVLDEAQKRVAEELYISPAPHTPTSSASTRKPACTHARKSLTTWKSTHPKASNSEGHNPGCVATPNPGLCPSEAPEPKTIGPKSSQSEGGTERAPRRATGQQKGRLATVNRHAANRPRSKTLTSYLYSSISALKAGMERLMTSADTQ